MGTGDLEKVFKTFSELQDSQTHARTVFPEICSRPFLNYKTLKRVVLLLVPPFGSRPFLNYKTLKPFLISKLSSTRSRPFLNYKTLKRAFTCHTQTRCSRPFLNYKTLKLSDLDLPTAIRSRPFLNYKTLKPQNVRSSPSQTTDSGSNSYSSNMQRSLSTIQLFSFGKALEW